MNNSSNARKGNDVHEEYLNDTSNASADVLDYDVGYTFTRFFQSTRWSEGEVFVVAGQNRQVKFEGGKRYIGTTSRDEIERLLGEPTMGEVVFKFFRKFHGDTIFNGTIESFTKVGTYVCQYDDNQVISHMKADMKRYKETNYWM